MLTDVFANRYEEATIWKEFGEREQRFLVQASKIISEQLLPLKDEAVIERFAHDVASRMCMEIGAQTLGPRTAAYGPFNQFTQTFTQMQVLCNYLNRPIEAQEVIDLYVKRRISVIELAFRRREEEVANQNATLKARLKQAQHNDQVLVKNPLLKMLHEQSGLLGVDATIQQNAEINRILQSNVQELNERLRAARIPLNYHNGFFQLSDDNFIETMIAAPFWALLSHEKWRNVELDMLEAIDRRDNGRRDAALSASKALESTLKIISTERGWTTGKESGASSFIDNLVSQNNGRFIDVWEAELLKAFFGKVRNPLGHGPGAAAMHRLTPQQDSWAIETCMSWIRSLATRA